MRVMVTGAAGFLGSHLVDALVGGGDEVVGVDNLHRGRLDNIDHLMASPGFEFRCLDIRDYAALADAMTGAEVVYHLAAQSTVMEACRDTEYTLSTNVGGTANVLRAATEAGVRRVVFASSREVYGECDRLPVKEETPPSPKNLYGATKLAGEALGEAWQASTGLEWQALRFANLYGPRDTGRVIPRWLDAAGRGKALTLYGGDQVLDFLWVGYAVDALLAASRCSGGGPVNVGSGQPTSLRKVAQAVQALAPRALQVNLAESREQEVHCFVAHVGRMSDRLGVAPPEEALGKLPETAAWYLSPERRAPTPAGDLASVSG